MNEEFETTKVSEATVVTPTTESVAEETTTSKKRTRKTKKEILAELEKEEKALQERKKALKAEISAEERKKRTKHLIEIGGAVYSVLGREYADGDVDKLIAFLKSQDSRGNYFSNAMK